MKLDIRKINALYIDYKYNLTDIFENEVEISENNLLKFLGTEKRSARPIEIKRNNLLFVE